MGCCVMAAAEGRGIAPQFSSQLMGRGMQHRSVGHGATILSTFPPQHRHTHTHTHTQTGLGFRSSDLSLAVCFGLLFSGTALKGRKRLLCTAGMAGSEPRGGQRARDGCPHCVHGANPWGLRDPGACDARPGLSLPCTASKWPSPPVGQAPSCGCQSPLPCSFQLRLACISLLCVASGLEVTFCVMSYKTVH